MGRSASGRIRVRARLSGAHVAIVGNCYIEIMPMGTRVELALADVALISSQCRMLGLRERLHAAGFRNVVAQPAAGLVHGVFAPYLTRKTPRVR